MAVLNITSGAISLGDIRSHLGASGSISIGDLRPGGSHHIQKNNIESFTLSNAYTSGSVFWRLKTTQRDTSTPLGGTAGTGTITNVYQQYAKYYNQQMLLHSDNTSTSRDITNSPSLSYTITSPNLINYKNVTLTRGSLASTGSFTTWVTETDSKGNFLNFIRSKSDYYRLSITNGKRVNGRTNLNPNTDSSGTTSFNDLYSFDDGVILDTEFDSTSTLLGFRKNYVGNANTGSIDDVYTTSRDSSLNNIGIFEVSKIIAQSTEMSFDYSPTGDAEVHRFAQIEVDGNLFTVGNASSYFGNAGLYFSTSGNTYDQIIKNTITVSSSVLNISNPAYNISLKVYA